MNKRFAVVTLAIILSVVLSMGVAVANPKYAITNLGPGGASGINDSGQVTGSTITPAGTHLFVYNGSVQDLDPAAMNSFGHDINSAGAIAGGDVDKGAFVYDGTFHWLGQGFSALGINDSGLVVGGSGGGASARATVYDGGWQDLATLGGTEGMCSGVNNAGLITGYSTTAEGYRHAFLYDGTIHDIGTLPGFSRSSGSAINASGIITGWSDNGDGTPGHVFVYDGTMHDLGTLPDSSWGEGCAINDAGTVVGYCRNSTSIASAFVYDESMQDLNSLIAPESGWVLQVACGINNAGQISGMGTYNGETSGFLLTPLPEISIGSPSVTTTSAGPVSFVVSYTGATSISLASDDITVNSIGTASAGNIEVTGDGTATRTVTLSDIAGSGTLGISIAAGSALNIDAPAPAAGPSETFAVANVPGVTISAPSATVTKSGPVTYTVTYTDATAVNLTTAKISLIKTGTASGSLAVSGTGTTSRTVKISSMRGNGTLAISVAAGTASNESGSAPSVGPSDSFAVYTSAPKVTIGAPTVAATKSGPVTYTVTYTNAANVNLSTAKITLKRTGTANGTVAVSGEGISTRTITL